MQAALKVNRDKAEAVTQSLLAKRFLDDSDKVGEDQKEGPDSESAPMELETEEGIASTTAASTTSAEYNFGEGIPTNFRGQYEIMGVVTHKGRSADSGNMILR